MALLGDYSGEKLTLSASLMAILGVSIFPYAIIQYTNSLLQSHGYAHVPVINMLVCGVVRLVVVYLLVGNPAIGILGAPIGGLLCYCAIAAMNLLAIGHLVPNKPKLLVNLLRSGLPALIMGVVVWVCYWGMENLLHITSRVLLCGLPICVGAVVFFVAVVLCKAITREDCQLLPKGDKIAKLLRL